MSQALIHESNGAAGPWFRQRASATVIVAAALTFAVFLGHFTIDDSDGATGLLFTFPIALLALAFGRPAGLLAGTVVAALLLVWASVDGVSLSAVNWVSRAAPLVLIGALVGDAATRDRRAQRADLELAEAKAREREAAEINDSIVQGLAVAKWSLELGDTDRALELVSSTMTTAQAHVTELLAARPIRPGDLRRAAGERAWANSAHRD